MPSILPTHRPRAFGEAFGVGLDGIELVVIWRDVNRAIRSDGGGGVHNSLSCFKFPEDGAGFLGYRFGAGYSFLDSGFNDAEPKQSVDTLKSLLSPQGSEQ